MAKQIQNLNGRKFALLDEKMWNLLKDRERSNELTESNTFQTAKTLNSKMEALLADPTIPESQKVQLYASLLKNFQNFQSKAPEIQKTQAPPTPDPSPRYIPEKSADKNISDYYIDDEYMDVDYPAWDPPKKQSTPLSTPFRSAQRSALSEDVPKEQEEDIRDVEPPRTPDEPAAEQFAAISSPVVESENEKRLQRVALLKEQLKLAPKDVLSFDNNTRELILYGRKYPGSSIDSIISYVSNHKPSEKIKPKDTALFLETFGSLNLDTSGIPNAKLRNIANAASGKGFGGGRIIRWHNFY